MLRQIIGFHQDEVNHWVADLTCGHAQHTRHDPPFFPRPWVLTETGRNAHLDTPLNCVRCDRQELPEDFMAYRRTPTFNEYDVPDGLRKNHSTKQGVWGMIHVLKGILRYRIYNPFNTEITLTAFSLGIVVPEIEHDVHPFEGTEFYVEFWRRPLQTDS